MKIFYSIILLSLLFISNVSKAHAESVGLSINPPIFKANLKPGRIITQVFTVQNLSETPKTFVARIVPFVAEDDQGHPTIRPDLQPEWLEFFSLANKNIHLYQPFILNGNQTEQLVLSITIPKKATQSDYYATLLIGTDTTTTSTANNSATTINTTIGANILLTVNDQEHPPTIIRIKSFEPLPEDILFRYGQYYFVDNLSPIHFRALAENAGKYMTETSGLFKVTKEDKTTYLGSLTPLNLISHSNREIMASPSGLLTLEPHLTDFGFHLASLEIRSENGSSRDEIVLVLLPFKLTLVTILALLTLLIVSKYQTLRSKVQPAKNESHPN